MDNKLAKRSLATLEQKLRCRGLSSLIISGHTGWNDDLVWAFPHREDVCNSLSRKPKIRDPLSSYDGYDEREDTEERFRTSPLLKPQHSKSYET